MPRAEWGLLKIWGGWRFGATRRGLSGMVALVACGSAVAFGANSGYLCRKGHCLVQGYVFAFSLGNRLLFHRCRMSTALTPVYEDGHLFIAESEGVMLRLSDDFDNDLGTRWVSVTETT
jgi:hypothetical protein